MWLNYLLFISPVISLFLKITSDQEFFYNYLQVIKLNISNINFKTDYNSKIVFTWSCSDHCWLLQCELLHTWNLKNTKTWLISWMRLKRQSNPLNALFLSFFRPGLFPFIKFLPSKSKSPTYEEIDDWKIKIEDSDELIEAESYSLLCWINIMMKCK